MIKHFIFFLLVAGCSKIDVGISTEKVVSVPTHATTFLSSKCSTEYYNTAPDDFHALFPDINMTNVSELKPIQSDNVYANYGGIFGNSFAALLNDGTAAAWGHAVTGGDNTQVLALNLSSANPVKKIYSGMLTHLAHLENGTIKSWGYPGFGAQIDTDALGITAANPVVKVVAGAFGYGFILQDGSLLTAGNVDLAQSQRLDANLSAVPVGKKAISLITNNSAFAALIDDGTVLVWGHPLYGGDQAQVNALGISNAVKIYSNQYSMAALLQDGTVKVWGEVSSGGSQTQVDALGFSSLNPVKEIVSNRTSAYAAILQDGTVKTWGDASRGGDQTAVDALNITSANPVKKLYTTYAAFIALMQDGTIKVWGRPNSGGDQAEVDALMISSSNPVKAVFPQNYEAGTIQSAVAVILQDGTVKTWGDDGLGGDQALVNALAITAANPAVTIYSNDYTAGSGFGGSFTALLKDGTIKVWGDPTRGGNQSQVDALGITPANPVINIYSSVAVNIALLKDGSIKTWGDASSLPAMNSSALWTNLSTNPITEMYSSLGGFVGVRKDGTVSVWGVESPGFNYGAIQSEVDALGFGTQRMLRRNDKICNVAKCSTGSIATNLKSCQ